MDDLHEETAKAAYELFERDGRRHGLDREHWLEAEQIVKARREVKQEAKEPKNKVPRRPRRQPIGAKRKEGQQERQDAQKSLAANAGQTPKRTAVKPGSK